MIQITFRKIVIILSFSLISQCFSQRWVPQDDFNHIKTFNNVLDKTISEISTIEPQDKNGKKYFSNKYYKQLH